MNYHFPDVSKQNRFHFIFLLSLKVSIRTALEALEQTPPTPPPLANVNNYGH